MKLLETSHGVRSTEPQTHLEFLSAESEVPEARRQLVQALDRNATLVNALNEAREQIAALKEEVDHLCARPRRTASVSR